MPGAPASQSWAFHGREDDRSPSTLTVPDTFMFSLLRPPTCKRTHPRTLAPGLVSARGPCAPRPHPQAARQARSSGLGAKSLISNLGPISQTSELQGPLLGAPCISPHAPWGKHFLSVPFGCEDLHTPPVW